MGPNLKSTIAILAMTAAAFARASEPGRIADTSDPVLESLVADALHANPDARSAEAEAQETRERVSPARTLPDPFLSFDYQNDGKSFTLGERDMTYLGAMVSQPLPWPGKLRLAGEAAEGDAKSIEAGAVGRSRLAIEARVRRAYSAWSLSNRLLDLIDERTQTWRQIEAVVRERYATGLAVQQDLLRAQAEVLRLDEERADEEARLRSRLAEVNRAAGRPQDAPIAGRGTLPDPNDGFGLPDLLAAARARSPEIAAASAALEADKTRLALARRNRMPDFVASGGAMYRGSLDPMWQVGLGISLPIHGKSRLDPLVREADFRRSADEARLSSASQEIDLRTRERFESLRAAVRVARLYRDGILPVDRLSFEAALASYKTGKVPFVTVLEALNAFFADRSAYLAREADAANLRVAIDEADLAAAPAMTSAPPNASGSSMAGSGAGSTGSMR